MPGSACNGSVTAPCRRKACSSHNVGAPACGGGSCNGTCAASTLDCNGDNLEDGCEVKALAPVADTYQVGETLIVQKWQAVTGATGYRCNTAPCAQVTTSQQLATALAVAQFLLADDVVTILNRCVAHAKGPNRIDWHHVEDSGAFLPSGLPTATLPVDGKALVAELQVIADSLRSLGREMGDIGGQLGLVSDAMRFGCTFPGRQSHPCAAKHRQPDPKFPTEISRGGPEVMALPAMLAGWVASSRLRRLAAPGLCRA